MQTLHEYLSVRKWDDSCSRVKVDGCAKTDKVQAESPFDVPILIPAYKPGESLAILVNALLERGVRRIIVVNDGSGPEFRERFTAISHPGVHLLEHAVNLGKGAALKTGMNHALVRYPDSPGVVTADADGQHHPEDILRVADSLVQHPNALVMGVRSFGESVPFRSRLGNDVTRVLMRVVLGQSLADTQTGLRGIPTTLMPHLLRLASNGYEFELDMLIACKHQDCTVVQEPIKTIYLEDNKSSHFHPIFDSMRIYFLLFRFTVLSVLTALLDNVVFALTYQRVHSIAEAQIAARLVAMVFNYAGRAGWYSIRSSATRSSCRNTSDWWRRTPRFRMR